MSRGMLGIREVSALLAVPAATIRSWERRHALAVIARDDSGQSRYADADIAALRRLRDAGAARSDLSGTVATKAPPVTLCLQLLDATHQLEEERIGAILDTSLHAHGLSVTVEGVLLPFMREVGTQWSRGRCDVAQEHLASAAVLGWLARTNAEAPPPLHERPVVLSCGPEDQHTIALDAFTVLLRHHRFDCRNLGAQTPARSLRMAVERCSASAVVVVSQLSVNRQAAVGALRTVSGTGAAVFYAGAAFRSTTARKGLPGLYLGGNLSQAAEHVANRLRHIA